MVTPGTLHETLTCGLEDVKVQRAAGLEPFGPDWRCWLAKESINHEVLGRALVEVAVRAPDAATVAVEGVTSLTEALCRALGDRFGPALRVLAGSHPTKATRLFGCPVAFGDPPLCDYDLVVSADVGARVPDPPWSSQRLSLAHPEVQARYLALLHSHRSALGARLDALIADNPKTVIFVSRKAFFNQIRMSAELRRRGWTTAAVVLDARLQEHKEGHFDALLASDLCSLLCWLSGSSGARIHTQGWLFRYHIPTLIDAFKPPTCRHVVETMDLNSMFLPPQDTDRTLAHMRAAWGESVERDHAVQCACERYLYRNADGVLFTGSGGYERELGIEALGRSRCFVHFLSYPLRDFFVEVPGVEAPPDGCDPRRLRLVFAGGVVAVEPRRPPALFGDAQLVGTFAPLVEAGLQLDVYNNPLLADGGSYEVLYREHLELARRHANYRFVEGGPPWELNRTLAEYDYGLMVYDFTGNLVGDKHMRSMIPAKLFMYLEAGLPVLVSSRIAAACRLVEQYGCGVAVEPVQLRDFPEFLRGLQHEELRRGAARARERLAMDGQIERLIAIYQDGRPDGSE
ncbi:MAG: hypothetical protein MJD61_15035 [Proteobacteria bacterium]|nr:hypothetical protein [Pseudomonadota bacterium]